MSKKKVLLMGKSGAGKTSMRSIIFANNVSRNSSVFLSICSVEVLDNIIYNKLIFYFKDCKRHSEIGRNYGRGTYKRPLLEQSYPEPLGLWYLSFKTLLFSQNGAYKFYFHQVGNGSSLNPILKTSLSFAMWRF